MNSNSENYLILTEKELVLLLKSDDKKAFAMKVGAGIYINTTGHEIEPKSLNPKTMRCCKCGEIYKNSTFIDISPCKCGGIFFETIEVAE